MPLKPLFGLLGILVAALTVEFNDLVVSAALGDIQGGLGLSRDQTTWIVSLYATGQLIGFTQATWWAATLSVRKLMMFAIALSFLTMIFIPLTSNLSVIYALRFLGGLSAGLTIPLLLTNALRHLGPSIRLYGLAAYALTATFGPNVSTALAALWTSQLSWHFIFLQDIPLCALSGVLVWFGVERTAPQYDRLAVYDWTGTLLVIAGFGALSTLLEQGDRLDWFNSRAITILSAVTVIALPLLVYNERNAKSPLFKFDLIARRNVAYALLALFAFLLLNLTANAVPINYLTQVAGFRTEQAYVVTAVIASLQIIALPATAAVLNIRWVDARTTSFIGFALILVACLGDSQLTSAWRGAQFVLWQILQAIGGPLVVISLLMMATNEVKKPEDGLFGSTLVNTTRGIAEPVGVWLIQLIFRLRGGLHYNRIVDQSGQGSFSAVGGARAGLAGFARAVSAQSAVLSLSDAFLIIGSLAAMLMFVLLVLPVRTYPPRIVFPDRT